MRKLYLLAFLVVPIVIAQAIPPGWLKRPTPKQSITYPLDRWGAVLAEDANTVTHLTFDGGALADSKNAGWSVLGSPTQNVATPMYPDGFTGASRKGTGGFSGTVGYYLTGTGGNDVLDFPNGFTCTFVILGLPAVNSFIVGDGGYSGKGWYANATGATDRALSSDFNCGAGTNQGPQTGTGGAAYFVDGVNVGSIGRVGGTGTNYVKLNMGASVSAGTLGYCVADTTAARLGRDNTGASWLNGATLVELVCSSSDWDETAVATQHRRAFGMLGPNGETINVSRSGNATYTAPGGTTYTAPPNVLRFGYEAADKYGAYITTDVVTVPTPSWLTPGSWGMSVVGAPDTTRSWTQAALPAAWAFGTDGAANSGRLYADGSGNLVFSVWGAAEKKGTVAHGFADGSAHKLAVTDMNGTMGLTIDGTPATLTMSGAGTGVPASLPASLRIGSSTTAGTGFTGYVRDLQIAQSGRSLSLGSSVVRFGIISDTHMTNTGHYVPTTEAMVPITSFGPDMLVHNGDILYEADDATWTSLLPSWTAIFSLPGVPHAYLIGNHDTGASATLAHVRSVFPTDATSWLQNGLLYGSRDLKGMHVVVLDAEYQENVEPAAHAGYGASATASGYVPQAELDWLAADLDATTKPTIIFMHQSAAPGLDPLWHVVNDAAVRAVLEARASKVVAIVNGHMHAPYYAVANGITYVGCASAGTQIGAQWTTHDKGAHLEIEINPTAKTARFGWWEDDSGANWTPAGYRETHVETKTW